MGIFYNDFDKNSTAWLSELISAGQLEKGSVDGRSISEILPGDLDGFRQAHFFAGIGGWPLALRLAGWPDEWEVWTGSCPCQPFSCAGKQKGVCDERHLWPEFLRLISECRPPVVFGEQVASRLGREWLAGVRADLEALGYAVGAADLCAAGVGAPHIRQRLFWGAVRLADVFGGGCGESGELGELSEIHGGGADKRLPFAGSSAFYDRLEDASITGLASERRGLFGGESIQASSAAGASSATDRLGISPRDGRLSRRAESGRPERVAEAGGGMGDGKRQGLAGWSGISGNDGPEQSSIERTGGDADGMSESYGGNTGAEGIQRRGEQRFEPHDREFNGMALSGGSERGAIPETCDA